MIREFIVECKDDSGEHMERILNATVREINEIALEYTNLGNHEELENILSRINDDTLPNFPGHVVINVFDENEELMEVIET